MSSYDRSARGGRAPVVVEPSDPQPMLEWLTRMGIRHPTRTVAAGTLVALIYSFSLTVVGTLAFTGWSRDLGRGEALALGALIPLLVAPPMIAGFVRLFRRLDRMGEALRMAAETDPLTGVFNRRGFFDRAEDQTASSHVVYMVDLDDFKRLNDEFGHDLGDRVLQDVAAWLTGSFGDGALVGRLGGDEFAGVAERLDPNLADQRHHFDLDGVPYSISIGATPLGVGETASEALMRADSSLYRVKSSTRPASERSR